MYEQFKGKRKSSGLPRNPDDSVLLKAVAEIKNTGGDLITLTKHFCNGRDDKDAVRRVMSWLEKAGQTYPKFEKALELPIPAARQAEFKPREPGAPKKAKLSAAQQAEMAKALGLKIAG